MKALLKKDWYLLITHYRLFLAMEIAYVTIFTFISDKTMGIMAIYLASLISTGLCTFEEKCGLDRLLTSLPYKRNNIVISRYITVMIFTAVILAVYMISMSIYDYYDIGYISKASLMMLMISAVGAVVMQSIALPFTYAFGSFGARIAMAMCCAVTISVTYVYIQDDPNRLIKIASFVSRNTAALCVLVPLASLCLLCASAVASCALYRRKEIA